MRSSSVISKLRAKAPADKKHLMCLMTAAFGNPKNIVAGSRLSGSGVMFLLFAFVSLGCAYVVWKHVHPVEEEGEEEMGGYDGIE